MFKMRTPFYSHDAYSLCGYCFFNFWHVYYGTGLDIFGAVFRHSLHALPASYVLDGLVYARAGFVTACPIFHLVSQFPCCVRGRAVPFNSCRLNISHSDFFSCCSQVDFRRRGRERLCPLLESSLSTTVLSDRNVFLYDVDKSEHNAQADFVYLLLYFVDKVTCKAHFLLVSGNGVDAIILWLCR